MNVLEFNYDDRCTIVATWRAVDESFDHELGREERWRAEVTKLEAWVCVGGHEVEIASYAEKTAPKVYAAMLAATVKRAQEELNDERGEAS